MSVRPYTVKVAVFSDEISKIVGGNRIPAINCPAIDNMVLHGMKRREELVSKKEGRMGLEG